MGEPTLKLIPPVPEQGEKRSLNATTVWNAKILLSVRWLANSAAFLFGDMMALLLSFYVAGLIRLWLKGGTMFPEWTAWILIMWTVLSLGTRLTPGWGLNAIEEIKKTTILLTTIFAGATSILFLTKIADETSRLTLGLSFTFCLLLVPLTRRIVKTLLISAQFWGMHVVVYGEKEKVADLIRILRDSIGIGYIPVGAFLTCGEEESHLEGVPIFPISQDPYVFADTAILVEPRIIEKEYPHFAERKLHQYRRVLLLPELEQYSPSLWITARDLGGTVGLEVSSNLLDPLARSLKMVFDLLTVLLTIPIMLPSLGFVAILVWLQDLHSPFFLQERIGRDGEPFRMWKFRTMRPDAEKVLERKLQEDEAFRNEWEKGCKVQLDPRITPIGRFLRRTSLDELPQFINVLKGEMSLIGPRPLPRYHDDQLPQNVCELRQRVRPGMTGLWQVSGRSESGNEGIIRWDSYYVRNWSIWLDIVILTRTFQAIIKGKGAY